MESLILHLIKNPTWMSLSMIFTIPLLFLFGILSLSFAAQADEEKEKGNPDKSKRSLIECILKVNPIYVVLISFVFFC